jgi:TRAP-type C4-dicarboxylate transport system permease small subunit
MSSIAAGRNRKNLLHSLSDRINAITEVALFITIVAMVIVTLLQVVFRFFFEALSWSEELSCFLLVLASLLGAAVAFKRGSHIAVRFILDKLPPVAQRALQTIISMLGIGFFAVVAYYGAILMGTEASQSSPALSLSMKWVYLMYPVTSGVIMLHFVDSIARTWEKH